MAFCIWCKDCCYFTKKTIGAILGSRHSLCYDIAARRGKNMSAGHPSLQPTTMYHKDCMYGETTECCHQACSAGGLARIVPGVRCEKKLHVCI